MLTSSPTRRVAFEAFLAEAEPRLRQALTATLGSDLGREATAEALAYAWEHWDRIAAMANPIGYLYVTGRDRGRRANRTRLVTLLPIEQPRIPWVEPGLVPSLEGLAERQRTVVVLIYCFEWSMSEVAAVLGVSKSTVQKHAMRGMETLRRRLGVEI